jgi:hypothetical protein
VLEPQLRKELDRLRYRGYQGGFISRHRALLFSPCDPAKIGEVLLLVVAGLALWYWSLDFVSRFWSWVLDFWASALGVGGVTGMIHYELVGLIHFSIPDFYAPARLPTTSMWWLGVLFAVALVVASLIVPRAYLPIAYMLRIVAFFQGCSQVFFAFWPEAFPYSVSGYIHTVLIASLMLISLMPIVLAFTYYLFDFGIWRNIALTLVIMGHLTVMVPLQYVFHAWILYHTSLLFLPLLFFVFGLPLSVMVFIAFYSWGFSWKNLLHEQRVQWKLRKRFV